MPDKEVERSPFSVALDQQIGSMAERLEQSPDGEYHFPLFRFSDQSPEVAAVHTMVSRLSMYFPNFMWSTSDNIDPNVKGLTVRWRAKSTPVPRKTHVSKELPNGSADS